VPHDLPIRSSLVSVVVVRLSADLPEYLLLRRATTYMHGHWCQVAGKIEAEETAWQAALRELAEETGLTPEALYSAQRIEQFYRQDVDALFFIPVFVAFVAPDAVVQLNFEHSDFRWCLLSEACELVPFVTQRENFAHVQAEFLDRAPNEILRIRG
jgi:dATP pyrophosphohydrolase